METIFDYNPTKEELQYISPDMDKEEYEAFFSDRTKALDLLYMLYDRKDERYKKYYNMLPFSDKNDFNRMLLHS